MNRPGPGGGERRSEERFEVNFRIQLMRADSPEVEGVVTDLSAGGCFVESEVEVREGDLTIWGNVVFWVKDTGFGVRFSAFSQGGAREKLTDLLGRTA
jgi:hypothetical protein